MSDCGVCLSAPDDGCLEAYTEAIRKARKPAKCCECGRTIEPRHMYHTAGGNFEGEWVRYRTCLVCHEIRSAFACYGFVFCGLWNDLEEYGFESINESCFAKLQTVEAKRYLRERWMKWKGII